MTREVSPAFQEAVNAQQTPVVFIYLLTINHESFVEPIRVCSDPNTDLPVAGVKGVVSRGEEFIFLPFQLTLATQDASSIAKGNITIDNISREIVAAVRNVSSAVSILIEVVLSSDLDTPEISVDNFKLETVVYDALTISGDLSVEYYDLEPFPKGRFTPSGFAGIF